MLNLLYDLEKYASNDDNEDEYFGPPGMTDAESKEKYDRLLATGKKLRGLGLYAALAGSGLHHIAPNITRTRARKLIDQQANLRERNRAHRNPNGLMLATPEMARTSQRVGRIGKGAALTGALLMGAGQASAGIAHRKRINYLEHALREKNKDQEKTASDVVDFASHAKKIADRNALKAKFVNPEDPIRKAQSAIQEYLDKEKEQQAGSEMRWSKINDLQASIDSDMDQLRKMDEQEAKVKLRSKKINKGVGIAGAGLATLGGGAYLYNRYKKKKRAQERD